MVTQSYTQNVWNPKTVHPTLRIGRGVAVAFQDMVRSHPTLVEKGSPEKHLIESVLLMGLGAWHDGKFAVMLYG